MKKPFYCKGKTKRVLIEFMGTEWLIENTVRCKEQCFDCCADVGERMRDNHQAADNEDLILNVPLKKPLPITLKMRSKEDNAHFLRIGEGLGNQHEPATKVTQLPNFQYIPNSALSDSIKAKWNRKIPCSQKKQSFFSKVWQSIKPVWL